MSRGRPLVAARNSWASSSWRRVLPWARTKLLHGLQQHAGGVAPQRRAAVVQDLVAHGPQRPQPLRRRALAALEGVEQVEHGAGQAQRLGRGQLLDAARVQVGIEERADGTRGLVPREERVHYPEELVVLTVEQQSRAALRHLVRSPADGGR